MQGLGNGTQSHGDAAQNGVIKGAGQGIKIIVRKRKPADIGFGGSNGDSMIGGE